MVGKAGAWSYSRMKDFETCAKQFYHRHVLKEFPFEETDATRYGTEFHKAAEDFIRDGTPVPERFSWAKETLQELADKPGEKHVELKFGLTEDLQPRSFFDRDVWLRGIVDYLSLDGDRAWIVDYKTGKNAKYADPDQLELMALLTFAHFPQVKTVNAALLYVVADAFIPERYHEYNRNQMWAGWYKRYARMEKAHETGVFNPAPSGLCRAHCPVLECVHNGKN